jgi:hypothetical protein
MAPIRAARLAIRRPGSRTKDLHPSQGWFQFIDLGGMKGYGRNSRRN